MIQIPREQDMKIILLKAGIAYILVLVGTGTLDFFHAFFYNPSALGSFLRGNAMAESKVSDQSRIFYVKQILDGQWNKQTIEIAPTERSIRMIGMDSYLAPPKPNNPEAIQMVLAFQLAPGKTRKDFARFKRVDGPWVTSNHGSNSATIWTKRQGDWVFDAFEDIVFASKKDFHRAYAGNEELNKAAEGLFGDKILIAIVEER